MKELILESGGRPIYTDDLSIIQNNIGILEKIFSTKYINTDFVISGCVLTTDKTTMAGITEGYIYLGGKIRHVPAKTFTAPQNQIAGLMPCVVAVNSESDQKVRYKDNSIHSLYTNYDAELRLLESPPAVSYMVMLKDSSITKSVVTYDEVAHKSIYETLDSLSPMQITEDEESTVYTYPSLEISQKRDKIDASNLDKIIQVTNPTLGIVGYIKTLKPSASSSKTFISQIKYYLNVNVIEVKVRYMNIGANDSTLSDGRTVSPFVWTEWEDINKEIKDQIANKVSVSDFASLQATVSEKADKSYADQIYAIISNLATAEQLSALSTAVQAKANASDVTAQLALKQDNLFGEVKMWAGQSVPENYKLCNGEALKQSDYPELYTAIGDTFNTAKDSSGNAYTTSSGYFRLPDLKGRFVVGYHDSDSDYNAKGKAGGEKMHTLTEAEMPSHYHKYVGDDELSNAGAIGKEPHAVENYDASSTSNGKVADYRTTSVGRGDAHENRPPYYVLAYIIRVK